MSGRQNFFSVFDIPVQFDLDMQALEKTYFQAQRTFHPDRLVGKDEAARALALSHSMLINEAYETLKSPLKRAQHILALNDVFVGSEKDSVKPSLGLLTEIMETREALDEAETPDAIQKLEDGNLESKGAVLAGLTKCFSAQHWPDAAELTIKLGYLTKLDDELRIKKKGTAAVI